MKLLAAAIVFAAAAATAPAPAPAPAAGKLEFKVLSVQGLVIGSPIRVDAKFGKDNFVAVPAPFTTVAPMHASFQTSVVNAPKPGTAFLKLNFAGPDGKTLLENVQFVPLEVPMGPAEQRIKQAADVLSTTGVQRTTDGKKNPTLKLVRQIKVGPYDAVEVVGTYDSDTLGLMYYRMVGILNPKSKDCVMALSNVVSAKVQVVTADDFAKTRSGVAIDNLRFLTAP